MTPSNKVALAPAAGFAARALARALRVGLGHRDRTRSSGGVWLKGNDRANAAIAGSEVRFR